MELKPAPSTKAYTDMSTDTLEKILFSASKASTPPVKPNYTRTNREIDRQSNRSGDLEGTCSMLNTDS